MFKQGTPIKEYSFLNMTKTPYHLGYMFKETIISKKIKTFD